MNPITLAIDIQTTLLVVFLDFPDFDSFAAVGPSACLVGTPLEGGARDTCVPGGAPETGDPGSVVTGERGGGAGAPVALTLKGFPACLNNKHHL